MSQILKDIKDDEIRIISSSRHIDSGNPQDSRPDPPKKGCGWKFVILLIGIVAVVLIVIFFLFVQSAPPKQLDDDAEVRYFNSNDENAKSIDDYREILAQSSQGVASHREKPYVLVSQATVGDFRLTILSPRNAAPRLMIGDSALSDSSAVLVVEAADVRADNGEINGSFVVDGRLLSHGQSKSGFCAIIGGDVILGVSDSTPYLERAIETGGYFFRQFPLVAGHHMVENKLATESKRRALAELDGRTVVVMTDDKMTLNLFAQVLVKLGVSNAVNLIGGSRSCAFAVERDGSRIEFGDWNADRHPNGNYIVWEAR